MSAKRLIRQTMQAEDVPDAIRRYWIALHGNDGVPGRAEIKDHMEEILQGLTSRQREALVRRAENHETLRESADAMGVSSELVRLEYDRALREAYIGTQAVLGRTVDPKDEPVEVLGITHNKCTVLHTYGIDTIGQLASKTVSELIEIRTIGNTMAMYLLQVSNDFISENTPN